MYLSIVYISYLHKNINNKKFWIKNMKGVPETFTLRRKYKITLLFISFGLNIVDIKFINKHVFT